jgi:hypothetical protein
MRVSGTFHQVILYVGPPSGVSQRNPVRLSLNGVLQKGLPVGSPDGFSPTFPKWCSSFVVSQSVPPRDSPRRVPPRVAALRESPTAIQLRGFVTGIPPCCVPHVMFPTRIRQGGSPTDVSNVFPMGGSPMEGPPRGHLGCPPWAVPQGESPGCFPKLFPPGKYRQMFPEGGSL